MWTPSSSREDQIIRFIIKRTHIGHIEAHREGERDLRLGAGLVVVGGSFAVDIACAPFRRHRGIRKRNELGGCIFASLENFSSRLAWEALLPGQRRWNHRKRNRRGENIFDAHTLSLSLLTHRYLSFYHHRHLSLFLLSLSIACSSSRRSSSSIVIAEPRRGKGRQTKRETTTTREKRLPKTRELETPQVVRYDRPFPQKEHIVVARKRPFYKFAPLFYQAAF